jgi:heptosyltransferase I
MTDPAQITLHRKLRTDAPRILIVRVGAMGDVIHALPAVAMLRELMPSAHIGWAIEPRWSPLLRSATATHHDPELMPLVDAVHPVEAKQWNKRPFSLETARSIAALRRELRSYRYDIAIDLQGTLRSAVIARLSGARKVVGSSSPREGLARLLYGTPVVTGAVHVVDQAGELVRAAQQQLAFKGFAGSQPQTRLDPPHSLLPRDPEAEAEWVRRRGELCQGRPLVLLAATAGWGAKEWPPAKFAELAAALVERGDCVLLNTPPGQVDPVTAQVLRSVQENFPLQARHVHPLSATLPLLIAAVRDANALIAGDTGPLHLAEALGKPTVGLFGPTDPRRTGPQRNSVCLRDSASVTDHRRHSETESGLARISVQAVLDALDSLTNAEEAR